jgi:hypothetical protein
MRGKSLISASDHLSPLPLVPMIVCCWEEVGSTNFARFVCVYASSGINPISGSHNSNRYNHHFSSALVSTKDSYSAYRYIDTGSELHTGSKQHRHTLPSITTRSSPNTPPHQPDHTTHINHLGFFILALFTFHPHSHSTPHNNPAIMLANSTTTTNHNNPNSKVLTAQDKQKAVEKYSEQITYSARYSGERGTFMLLSSITS